MKQEESKIRANLNKLRRVKQFPELTAVADSLERLLDGATKGGNNRAKKLSKKRRSEIAKNASNVRWAKVKGGKK